MSVGILQTVQVTAFLQTVYSSHCLQGSRAPMHIADRVADHSQLLQSTHLYSRGNRARVHTPAGTPRDLSQKQPHISFHSKDTSSGESIQDDRPSLYKQLTRTISQKGVTRFSKQYFTHAKSLTVLSWQLYAICECHAYSRQGATVLMRIHQAVEAAMLASSLAHPK